MHLSESVKNLVGNLFRMDLNLDFFAPGYIGSKKTEEDNIPWLGLKNLNRVVYLATTFNYYFFENMIADVSLAIDAKGKEPIIVEVKDSFVELIELEKLGFLQSRVQSLSTPQMFILKDIYKFMIDKYAKFNEFFENDPNIKILAKHQGPLSAPLFLNSREVVDYYEKGAKIIFTLGK
ncbi:hypothetical protein [Spiroplasma tabanidicola]|uniref:Uncharacterized protein n=1 Tax=Spiroplasma tabanidicola TaxID=324079 RepID=A0A6I6C8W3_9MOLU|nr:hypothetical protein [Spiroplasma tabanidicola]QGS51899.1 hypothetical protein STABA_v1c05360 [Spiroplasma tabanidicola]